MKLKKKMLCGLLISGICCLNFLGGCTSEGESSSGGTDILTEEEQQNLDKDTQQELRGDEERENSNVGEFAMQDISGETYTQDMFADSELTMINVFTTWCTPCVNEIPDLEKLHQEMESQGVRVVGIVLDAIDGSGSADENTVKKAELLAEKTGATYPFLIPEPGYLNGRLAGISAVPETFFVDKEGNIVGETYTGSRSLEDWRSIVEKELEGVTP